MFSRTGIQVSEPLIQAGSRGAKPRSKAKCLPSRVAHPSIPGAQAIPCGVWKLVTHLESLPSCSRGIETGNANLCQKNNSF